MATDMNTLLRYMEPNGITNVRIESIPATVLHHLLSKLFMTTRRKYGEEYELATIFSFQRFEKSRCVLAAKRESLVHEHGKGNKPQTAQPTIDENEEEALFEAGEF